MADYRITTMGGLWVSVYWRDDLRHTPYVEDALTALSEIPGVSRHPYAIDVPHTAWRTQEWIGFAAITGVDADAGWDDLQRRLGLDSTAVDDPLRLKDIQDFDAFYNDHRPSFPHQIEGASKAMQSGMLLLCDQMGLGKTQTALLAAHYFSREQQKAALGRDLGEGPSFLVREPLIVLGPLFTRDVWRRELSSLAMIEGRDDLGSEQAGRFCVLEGRNNQASLFDENASVYFIHYDVVNDWFPRFASRPPSVVIADEAHYLRNASTGRARGASVLLGAAQFRILLTGTPIENKPQDLHSLLTITTGKGTWGSKGDFRIRYCGATPGPYRGLEDGAPTNVTELRQRMEPYYLRRMVEDTGQNLPGFSRSCIHVENTGKRSDLYLQTLKSGPMPTAQELLHALEHGAQSEVLTLIHQLRTITSDMKRETTLAMLDSFREQSEPCVVFTWSRSQAEYLHRRLNTMDAFCVHGGFPIAARDQCVRDFQELGAEGRPAVMIATFGSLREGVTLHSARHLIFHDLDWSAAAMAQAEKRIHRIGQTRACVAHWLVADRTMDHLFATALITKVAHADASIGVDYGFADLAHSLKSSMVVDLKQEIEDALEAWRSWRAK